MPFPLAGLAAYYAFESLLLDSTGNGKTLVNNNGVAQAPGIIGKAASFGGVNQGLTGASLGGTFQMSHAFWLQSSAPQTAIWGDYDPASTKGYLLELVPSGIGVTLNWTELVSFSSGTTPVFSVSSLADIAVVYDGTQTGNANRLKIYVNGAQQSLTFSGTIPSSLAYVSGQSFLSIGGESTLFAQFWKGLVDEYGIWNGYALTAADVAYLWNGGAGTTYPAFVSGLSVSWSVGYRSLTWAALVRTLTWSIDARSLIWTAYNRPLTWAASSRSLTWSSGMSAALQEIDILEKRILTFDFSQDKSILAGQTIASVVITQTGPAGSTALTLGTVATSGSQVQVPISGGTEGKTYSLKCAATLANGEIVVVPGQLLIL